MISFFKHKRGFNLDTIEDSLTSTVFDNLKHLPTEIIWRILHNSLLYGNLPTLSGEIEYIGFWENWNPEGTHNTVKIEPDVFIRFQNLDLIIEAKRYNENQQKFQQMQDQLIAYCNEFYDDGKDIYYYQLGGLNEEVHQDKHNIKDKNKQATIIKGNWSSLLDSVISEKKHLTLVNLSYVKTYIRILEDIIFGMELHQFYRKKWMDKLSKLKIELVDFNGFRKRNRYEP